MRKGLLLFCLSTLLVHTGCRSHEEVNEEETRFLVTSPLRMDTSVTQEYVCQIKSISHIELQAQERGYLEKIYVDEGQFVRKGQPLFQIMPNLYEAELRRAKAEVEFAEIEYNNTKRLAESNVVAPNELAMAAAKLNKANAELALAEVHLNFTEIKAPFDGIIDRFHVRLGSLIEEGDLLTTLSDNSEMWVYFNVPEAEYLDYRSRVKRDSIVPAELRMANNKMFAYPGEVRTIEADFNHETGNISFRATFPNPDGLLRHGETGNIVTRVPLRNALIIPQKATFEILDKKYVFVIDEGDVIKAREVTVSAEMPHLYAISRGLEETDTILLEGLRQVKEGDEIMYDFVDPASVVNGQKLYAE